MTAPIDITGLTGTKSFSRTLSTGNGAVSPSFDAVTITVDLQQVFACAAPSPTP